MQEAARSRHVVLGQVVLATEVPLVPFGGGQGPVRVWAALQVVEAGAALTARYRLSGEAEVMLGAAAGGPARRDGLWQDTCFELFVGPEEEEGYLEVNLSPNGDWNVYSFCGYRQGMAAAPGTPLKVIGEGEPGFRLELPAAWAGKALRAGPCAVLRHRDGALSYWAARHEGERPDFHRRSGWTVHLVG